MRLARWATVLVLLAGASSVAAAVSAASGCISVAQLKKTTGRPLSAMSTNGRSRLWPPSAGAIAAHIAAPLYRNRRR